MLLSNLLSLFYPRTCPMCERYVSGLPQGAICPSCLIKLPRTEQAEKRQNETEMALAGTSSPLVRDTGMTMIRTMRVMHLERAAAYLFYEKDHPIQRLIHLMKYADQPLIGYQLGKQAAMEMQFADFFDEIDVIVPIPLHPNRMNERGYNQSEYIAQGISEVTGIPVDTTHVARVKNTPKQALQTGEGRRHNVTDAFAVNHPEQLYHKRILVVDDLLTTGATMKACLKAMRMIRGASFSVMTLCKAR